MKILIVASVQDELYHLIQSLENKKRVPDSMFYTYTGTINEINILLTISGPGIVNSVVCLTSTIESHHPDFIIMTGCAGIYKISGLKIGDVAIALSETDIHSGIENKYRNPELSPLPFNLIERESIKIKNNYSVFPWIKKMIMEFLHDSKLKDFKVECGNFISVSSITASEEKAIFLEKTFKPIMESMEGNGLFHVSILYQIPSVEIRAGSNYVGKRDRKSWNLELSFLNSNLIVMEFIDYLAKLKHQKKI